MSKCKCKYFCILDRDILGCSLKMTSILILVFGQYLSYNYGKMYIC